MRPAQPVAVRRAHPAERPGTDDGSATVVVLALCSVLVLLAGGCAALGVVAVARHRAATAADLGALAAAQHAPDGDGCRRAAAVVVAAEALLTACRLTGDTAVVEVVVHPPGPVGALGAARAVARAGPARSLSSG